MVQALLDPREQLIGHLNAWAGMNESRWPQAKVQELYGRIISIFREHADAKRWYETWRRSRANAQLV